MKPTPIVYVPVDIKERLPDSEKDILVILRCTGKGRIVELDHWLEPQQDKYILSKEELEAFAKKLFYAGFEKCKNDDADCFTAWREEARNLL